ncbi:MAG: ABC transporter permease [Syntrophobacteraceae bacterium]
MSTRYPKTSRVISIAAGLAVCVVIAGVAGVGPWELLKAIAEGSFGSPQAAAATIAKLTPLILNGLAVAIAYRAGLLNIGCEGQMTLGALAAASLACRANGWPGAVSVPVALALGGLIGAVWAMPALWLRRRRNVHEVLTTLLLNTLALHLADLLVVGPLGDGTAIGRTALIAPQAYLPSFVVGRGATVSMAPFIAIAIALASQVWLARTVWGFEARATGINPLAARVSGIDADGWQRWLFVLSGFLAGLAGAIEVLGVHHRFYRAFSPGYGFDGITVAFLANGSPGWLCVSGLLLAMLRSADKWLQLSLNISPSLIWIIQAMLLLSVTCHARFGLDRILGMVGVRGARSEGRADEGARP